MFKTIKYILFTSLVISSLLLTACGAKNIQDEVIQTAVAQTVTAQNSNQIPNTETLPVPATSFTQTPVQFSPTLTPLAGIASPTQPLNTTKFECAKASLASETIVDGTIFKPGVQFTKSWQITNTSTCVWDTSYKIVFLSGDLLGGGYVYNLPRVTGPGQTVPIDLVLIAPATDGEYTSKWMLQTPDNYMFGVGSYSAPFYTKIVVSSAEKPNYAVTSIVTSVTRDPITGCPANTLITVYATVSTNGPLEFTYHWEQSDSNNSSPKVYSILSASTKTFTREWKFGRAATQGPKWISFVITDPVSKEQQADFVFQCP
jgi:hypothetical protein